MESATHPHPRSWSSTRLRDRLRAVPLPRPELAALLTLAAVLYLWGLSNNGWANDYYAAAVRSMAGSWHDFLYGSFDAKGLMTVDKPPLALWVEALSAKLYGFNSLAILVPQALMGVASVGLLYDLTRRRWGRVAGTVAGLALALTPVVVAISRHNNPDALLVLCSVGALWCFVRALEGGATKWLVAAAVCVGLGFEAKMGAALMVVPGMALAWLWVAPRGRVVAMRQLAIAGAALLAVALAWPVLVWLTPAASRPWISGTSDNSIWSLIWEYNGFGRLEGQTGGPASLGTSGTFGGATGPLRLLNEALGGQAGWLLGAALAGGLGIAALSRLRRTDARTGWIIAVGGAFATTAVAFSFAGGIFHPYYTSLLAPFAAALVGAIVGQVLRDGQASRIVGAVAIGLGAVVQLMVIENSASDLDWLVVPLVVVSVAAAFALLFGHNRLRQAALVCAVAILLVGPAIWSVGTLGHPTSGTFPAGGPESASTTVGSAGGMFGGEDLSSVLEYTESHGGGTIAVDSQSGAASSIIEDGAEVAGIGGFSGKESSVSAEWLEERVESGAIVWIYTSGSAAGFGGTGAPGGGSSSGGSGGDTRTGSESAIDTVVKSCTEVDSSEYESGGESTAGGTLYQCSDS
ncbi:MAG: glycosyltransferase family 39 protein [Solirubrobacterales bacterium]|nr:glycosyltransferase family 39 protein [Solirubrobacterales bacterium]